MKHDNAFLPENIDEQVEHSIATSFQQASPESKMLQRLSALYEADRRSTERVEQRLAQHLARHQETTHSSLKLLAPIPTTREGRKPSMQTREYPTHRRATSRFALVAAALFASLLVGSLLMVLNLAHSSHPGGPTASQPTTTAGIYFNRANEVYRLDTQTRKVIWHTHLTNQPVRIIANKSESVVGNPTVIGANVYISAATMLTALDAQTGTFRWSRTFDASLGGLRPFEDNGQLYVKGMMSLQKSALYAINPANGTTIATYTPIEEQRVWNDPTVVNGVLYYQTGDVWNARIYAVQLPSEKLLWHATLSKQQMFTGILVQDGVVYIDSQVENGGSSTNKGRVEAFDAGNGHKIWQSPDLGSPVRTLAIANNLIYIATVSNGLMAFDRQAHTLAWQKPYNTFAIQADNTILYVGYLLGSSTALAALNTTSGQLLWQKTYGGNGGMETLASRVETFVVSSGIFYGLSWNGNQGTIYAVNASSGTQLWAMPNVASFSQWGGITIVS